MGPLTLHAHGRDFPFKLGKRVSVCGARETGGGDGESWKCLFKSKMRSDPGMARALIRGLDESHSLVIGGTDGVLYAFLMS